MRYDEQEIQMMVVQYIRLKYPKILFTCAPAYAKSARQGSLNKRMGYLKGWPDIFIAYPSNGYYGLFIEFKTEKGKIQPEQEKIKNKLSDLGYKAVICRGYDEAVFVLDNYLK